MKKNFFAKLGLFLFIFGFNSFINLSFANERIVIAGGSLTEIVFALGAGDQVVGVDKTSSYPSKAKQLPQIGYWKLLNIEGILSLKPSLFITLSDAEPDNIISQVTQAKVDVLSLQRVPGTTELLYANIEKIADKLNKQPQGQQLINKIKTNLTKIQEKISNHPNKPKVLFLMSMGGTNSVAGKNTTADALITIAGGENLAKHTSYKTYTAESLIAMDPEIIVLNKHSIEQLGGMEKLNTIAGITETSAYKNHRIIAIDDSYLFGIGPRVDEVAQILYQHFYPQ
ncbi:heme/hemin ABC transporter substrate-binding protein [Gilliamella sp. ESL0254]|uniref:heme/hemin ABC transporter substrate-binding protein n=1 Tax=Gilliamella sp. ESL0254 TaxID=2705035 RepID=UPI0015808093|nr:ABC transporter substrate-binding protein [Gilliamella sp. ESL0254]NUF26823.1 ABC transporter substrate-binding protein [Gilliamella sp. ESL0254]